MKNELFQLALEYSLTVQRIKELEEWKKTLSESLIPLLDSEVSVTDPDTGHTYRVIKTDVKETVRLDASRLKKECPDTYERFRTQTVKGYAKLTVK